MFSLVIQEIINAIKTKCPGLKLNQWYLDGVIAGKAEEVATALSIIQEMGPELGMDLNLKTNEVVNFRTRLTTSQRILNGFTVTLSCWVVPLEISPFVQISS